MDAKNNQIKIDEDFLRMIAYLFSQEILDKRSASKKYFSDVNFREFSSPIPGLTEKIILNEVRASGIDNSAYPDISSVSLLREKKEFFDALSLFSMEYVAKAFTGFDLGAILRLFSVYTISQSSNFRLHESLELFRKSFFSKDFINNVKLKGFDEDFYLAFYPDIKKAVQSGEIPSGLYHFVASGFYEGRVGWRNLEECAEKKIQGISIPVAFSRSRVFTKKIQPPSIHVREGSDSRFVVLLPHLNPDISFGGYAAFFGFLEFLSSYRKIDFVITEDEYDKGDYIRYVDKRRLFHSSGIYNKFHDSIGICNNDILIAYSALDLYICDSVRRVSGLKKRPIAFIQEDERMFHDFGAMRAIVDMAYRKPHFPIFNSNHLQEYFKKNKVGCYYSDNDEVDYLAFDHVISKPAFLVPHQYRKKRVVIYFRPEMHAARNLPEIILMSLTRLADYRVIPSGWEIVCIGALGRNKVYSLADGTRILMLQKSEPEAYYKMLSDSRVGLSFMYAAHPSVLPFEFVNYGLLTIVNITDERKADYYQSINDKFRPVELDIELIGDKLLDVLKESDNLIEDFDSKKEDMRPQKSNIKTWHSVFSEAYFKNKLEGFLNE